MHCAGAAASHGDHNGLFGRVEHLPAHSPSWPGPMRSVTQATPTVQEGVKRAVFACCSARGWINSALFALRIDELFSET